MKSYLPSWITGSNALKGRDEPKRTFGFENDFSKVSAPLGLFFSIH